MSNFETLQSQWTDWARQAQSGDKSAYRELLTSLAPYIQRQVRKKIASPELVEDIGQECLIAVHKSLASYDSSRPFSAWLHSIIKFKIADFFRDRQKHDEISKISEMDVTNGEPTTNTIETGGLRDALQSLPPPLLTAVDLVKIQGLSYEQAAEKEGVQPAAMRKRVSRAFQKIANWLEDST